MDEDLRGYKDRRVVLEGQQVLKEKLENQEHPVHKDLRVRKVLRVCRVLAQIKQVPRVQQVLQDCSA